MARKVLVIEDEPEMLELVKYTLEQGGFEVHTCDNGYRAWETIVKVKPDVLVLDVMLPGVDGYSMQIKIAEEPATKDLPVVIVTAVEPTKNLFLKFPQVRGFLTNPLGGSTGGQ
ncbi:MAG: response regulator [Elusimicrobia bacterium]|nr:response regulator [Elusimicrobiota bacterium]